MPQSGALRGATADSFPVHRQVGDAIRLPRNARLAEASTSYRGRSAGPADEITWHVLPGSPLPPPGSSPFWMPARLAVAPVRREPEPRQGKRRTFRTSLIRKRWCGKRDALLGHTLPFLPPPHPGSVPNACVPLRSAVGSPRGRRPPRPRLTRSRGRTRGSCGAAWSRSGSPPAPPPPPTGSWPACSTAARARPSATATRSGSTRRGRGSQFGSCRGGTGSGAGGRARSATPAAPRPAL